MVLHGEALEMVTHQRDVEEPDQLGGGQGTENHLQQTMTFLFREELCYYRLIV